MNSKLLGLHGEDLPEIKPAAIPFWKGEEPRETHSFLRSYWKLVGAGGGVSFLQNEVSERLSVLQYRAIQPCIYNSVKWTQRLFFF